MNIEEKLITIPLEDNKRIVFRFTRVDASSDWMCTATDETLTDINALLTKHLT